MKSRSGLSYSIWDAAETGFRKHQSACIVKQIFAQPANEVAGENDEWSMDLLVLTVVADRRMAFNRPRKTLIRTI